jgi:hypothetical protein
MDKFEKRIEKIETMPEALRLREDIRRAINAYQRFLENFGFEVYASLGPKPPADSETIVRWHEVKPARH